MFRLYKYNVIDKAGLDDKAFDMARYKPKKCEELIKPDEIGNYWPMKCEEELRPLTLDHILLQLVLLGIFMLLGTVVFLMEIYFKKG